MTWAMYFDWYLKSLIVSAATAALVCILGIILLMLDNRRR